MIFLKISDITPSLHRMLRPQSFMVIKSQINKIFIQLSCFFFLGRAIQLRKEDSRMIVMITAKTILTKENWK